MTDNNGAEEIPQIELNLEHYWGVFLDTDCLAILQTKNAAERYAQAHLCELIDRQILEIGRKREDGARQITTALGEPDESLAVCGRCGETEK